MPMDGLLQRALLISSRIRVFTVVCVVESGRAANGPWLVLSTGKDAYYMHAHVFVVSIYQVACCHRVAKNRQKKRFEIQIT